MRVLVCIIRAMTFSSLLEAASDCWNTRRCFLFHFAGPAPPDVRVLVFIIRAMTSSSLVGQTRAQGKVYSRKTATKSWIVCRETGTHTWPVSFPPLCGGSLRKQTQAGKLYKETDHSLLHLLQGKLIICLSYVCLSPFVSVVLPVFVCPCICLSGWLSVYLSSCLSGVGRGSGRGNGKV